MNGKDVISRPNLNDAFLDKHFEEVFNGDTTVLDLESFFPERPEHTALQAALDAVVEALQSSPRLEVVKVGGMFWGDEWEYTCPPKLLTGLKSAIQSPSGTSAKLRTLSFVDSTLADHGGALLAAGLHGCRTLEELDVSSTGMSDKGCSYVANSARGLPRLRRLYMAACGWAQETAEELACVFEAGVPLEVLDLSFRCFWSRIPEIGKLTVAHEIATEVLGFSPDHLPEDSERALSKGLLLSRTIVDLRLDAFIRASEDMDGQAKAKKLATGKRIVEALEGKEHMHSLSIRECYLKGSGESLARLAASSEFRFLDVRDCKLSPEDGHKLAAGAAKAVSLERLWLSGNPIGIGKRYGRSQLIYPLKRALLWREGLSDLAVSRCQLSEDEIGDLCEAIQGRKKPVESVACGANFACVAHSVGKLCEAQDRRSQQVSRQSVSMTSSGDENMEGTKGQMVLAWHVDFSQSRSSPECNKRELQRALAVENLRLDGSGMEEFLFGYRFVSRAVEGNFRLHFLSLVKSDIGDKGLKEVAEVLKRRRSANCPMHALDVSKNHAGYKGIAALAKVVARGGAVHELNVSGNIFGRKGAEALANAVKKGNDGLRALRMRKCGIAEPGMRAVAKAAASSSRLEELDIGCNALTPALGKLLSTVLRESGSIRVLKLDGEGRKAQGWIGEVGTRAMLSEMSKAVRLEELRLGVRSLPTNVLKRHDLIKLAHAEAARHPSLQTLEVDECHLSIRNVFWFHEDGKFIREHGPEGKKGDDSESTMRLGAGSGFRALDVGIVPKISRRGSSCSEQQSNEEVEEEEEEEKEPEAEPQYHGDGMPIEAASEEDVDREEDLHEEEHALAESDRLAAVPSLMQEEEEEEEEVEEEEPQYHEDAVPIEATAEEGVEEKESLIEEHEEEYKTRMEASPEPDGDWSPGTADEDVEGEDGVLEKEEEREPSLEPEGEVISAQGTPKAESEDLYRNQTCDKAILAKEVEDDGALSLQAVLSDQVAAVEEVGCEQHEQPVSLTRDEELMQDEHTAQLYCQPEEEEPEHLQPSTGNSSHGNWEITAREDKAVQVKPVVPAANTVTPVKQDEPEREPSPKPIRADVTKPAEPYLGRLQQRAEERRLRRQERRKQAEKSPEQSPGKQSRRKKQRERPPLLLAPEWRVTIVSAGTSVRAGHMQALLQR